MVFVKTSLENYDSQLINVLYLVAPRIAEISIRSYGAKTAGFA
jgi:hypothetical protein